MKLNKTYLQNVIKEEFNRFLNEELGVKKPSKRSLINKLYKVISPITGRIYNDDYWLGVKDIREAIASLGVDDYEVYPINGGYRSNGDGAQWKEYQVNILWHGVEIHGTLNCHAAGTIEDPFSRYDMACVLY